MNLTRARAGFAALALILLPSLAFAQGAAVYQSGTMSAPHDLAKITRNGQIQDASPNGVAGDANGRGVNPFAVLDSNNLGICSYASTNGNKLCLGHNSGGSPIFNINGTEYAFSPSASGNVTGPGSSTTNHLTLFNSGAGTLLKDSADAQALHTYTFPGAFAGVPIDAFRVSTGSYLAANKIPSGIHEAFACENVVPGSYTATPWPNTACSAYILSSNGQSGNSSVGYFAYSGSAVNGVNPYGGNFVVSNATTGIAATNGTGFDFNVLVGHEIDLNIMKKGAATPTGIAYGLYLIGGSETNPASGSVGIEIEPLNASNALGWNTFLNSTAGAAGNFAIVGEATTAATSTSQPIVFHSKSAGVSKSATISALSGGDVSLTPNAGSAVAINGLLAANGVAPGVVSCGGSPAVDGTSNNVRGKVTPGSGSPTSCQLNWASGGYTAAPICVVATNDVAKPVAVTSSSTTTLVVGLTAGTASFTYMCMQ